MKYCHITAAAQPRRVVVPAMISCIGKPCDARPIVVAGYSTLAAARSVPGSFSFKQNWGFEPQKLHYRFRLKPGESIPDHNPLNPKYRMFIAAWKRLPLPVANALGPFIVRGVG